MKSAAKTRTVIAALVLFSLSAATARADGLPRRAKTPRETYPGVDVLYDSIRDAQNHRLRLILTRPHEGPGPYPTIFVAGWLSCDSVEAPPGTHDATGQVFQALAVLPGFATVRLDKPGVGDSEGVCADTDFDTELAAYRAAFRSLKNYGFIDRDKLFVFGISNGGGFAPLVAEGAPVRGYVSDGGWLKTWYEHMLEIERRRLILAGKTPAEVNALMRLEARLYQAFLLEGQAPAALFARSPELRQAWAGEDDGRLYGRPAAYYQQLQKLDLEGAWARVKVPVLALHGQYDWIMSGDDIERIASLVNANAPGAAQFVELPATGHTFEHYASQEAAFKSKESPFDPAIARLIADWFDRHR